MRDNVGKRDDSVIAGLAWIAALTMFGFMVAITTMAVLEYRP